MREFVFTVEYERGADDLMDLFIEFPDLHARTPSIHATADAVWKLTRVTGPDEALAAFDDRLPEVSRCVDVVGMCGCPVVEWEYEVLSSTPGSRIVYSCQRESGDARSIPYVAAKHVGDGLLMQAERRGNRYRWRLLIGDDDTVSAIYEELREGLRAGLSISVDRLGDASGWVDDGVETDDLVPEQQAALEAAVASGYYETPRRMSVQEIAEALDVPTSTFQYRLTRAEAWLATRFVSRALGGRTSVEVDAETGV
ncbi:transcriptional regulator [Salinigranum rubrum]|uniref:Transcriptional regulator n=1 Tax=Salinigranum rubrum TaxID=755307 RepID=A0A2I8VIN5_9EURY|nr:helix-turn-helix domain-containing protein [Salinigranum rubrum]AUV81796.1 transcriptional regulator [Salinigranum rubrum]